MIFKTIILTTLLVLVGASSGSGYIDTGISLVSKNKTKPAKPKPEPYWVSTNSTLPHNKAHYNISIHEDSKSAIAKHLIDEQKFYI